MHQRKCGDRKRGASFAASRQWGSPSCRGILRGTPSMPTKGEGERKSMGNRPGASWGTFPSAGAAAGLGPNWAQASVGLFFSFFRDPRCPRHARAPPLTPQRFREGRRGRHNPRTRRGRSDEPPNLLQPKRLREHREGTFTSERMYTSRLVSNRLEAKSGGTRPRKGLGPAGG